MNEIRSERSEFWRELAAAKLEVLSDEDQRYVNTVDTNAGAGLGLVRLVLERRDGRTKTDPPFTTQGEKEAVTPRAVEFITMVGHEKPISVRSVTNDGGSIMVPYLTWGREEDLGAGPPTALILDGRLMYVLPAVMPDYEIEHLVEFIANAIAIGAGYASIYYTKRKMPFRG